MSQCAVNTKAIKRLMRSVLIEPPRRKEEVGAMIRRHMQDVQAEAK